jgi:hypothetical protein
MIATPIDTRPLFSIEPQPEFFLTSTRGSLVLATGESGDFKDTMVMVGFYIDSRERVMLAGSFFLN